MNTAVFVWSQYGELLGWGVGSFDKDSAQKFALAHQNFINGHGSNPGWYHLVTPENFPAYLEYFKEHGFPRFGNVGYSAVQSLCEVLWSVLRSSGDPKAKRLMTSLRKLEGEALQLDWKNIPEFMGKAHPVVPESFNWFQFRHPILY